ncbi:hypothetical protein [Nannocystis bainbridge]|uniref:Uncharacterized protein n=1 Tax=Nannocystis bainbridge TaxID=2995303 RepID=A0ABT5EBD4_9BACT|nr:hypothetical protein [Nannocystis bainbridge]MDC0723171.1 hypothetical protein [Nannocystis bainbridge]
MARAHSWLACIVTLACAPKPADTETDGESVSGPGTTSDTSPTTDDGPPSSTSTDSTTGDPPGPTTSAASTTTDTSDGTTTLTSSTTGDTTTSDSTTGDTTTTGESAVDCGPPCPEALEFEGNVEIGPGDSTEFMACVTRVTGSIHITGDLTVAQLAGFANLVTASALQLDSNAVLTDLSPLACVEDLFSLRIEDTPALTDMSALANLKRLVTLDIFATGITSLPTFAPDYEGIEELHVVGNPALVDVDALATLKYSGITALEVLLADNATLADLSPSAALFAQAGPDMTLRLRSLPELASLAGLETIAAAGLLSLRDLPQVPDLAQLAALEQVHTLQVSGLPQVTDLHGLEQLKLVDVNLAIGDCSQTGFRMDGLTSLAGLDALTSARFLVVTNSPGLTSLDGLGSVQELVKSLQFIDTQVTPAQVDGWVQQQLNAPPEQLCVGDWDDCPCIPQVD